MHLSVIAVSAIGTSIGEQSRLFALVSSLSSSVTSQHSIGPLSSVIEIFTLIDFYSSLVLKFEKIQPTSERVDTSTAKVII